MNNLINYIKLNQDKTFLELPFNEVDAAIFSTLSYVNFVGIINKEITIKKAYQLFSNRINLKVNDFFNKKNIEVFKSISNTKRFSNILLSNYKLLIDNFTQFGALTISSDIFKFIAFEGTTDDLIGWKEDFSLAYTYPIKAQSLALEYAKENIKLTDKLVFLGGHSKGGNLAIYAGAYLNIFKRHKIKTIYNFDGPGFLNENLNDFKRIENKIISYYPYESVVGMLLSNTGKSVIVKSNAYQILQHNIHSWIIEDNAFKTAILSDYSKNIKNKTIHVLKKYSKREIEYFVNTIFGLLSSISYNYQRDLKKLSIIRIKNVLNNIKNIRDEDKKLILEIFKTLIIRDKNDDI